MCGTIRIILQDTPQVKWSADRWATDTVWLNLHEEPEQRANGCDREPGRGRTWNCYSRWLQLLLGRWINWNGVPTLDLKPCLPGLLVGTYLAAMESVVWSPAVHKTGYSTECLQPSNSERSAIQGHGQLHRVQGQPGSQGDILIQVSQRTQEAEAGDHKL